MSNRLAALKAQYASEDKRQEGPRESFSQNNYYPFWNMKPGQRAVIRFLPDLDENNIRGFLVEKSFHSLEINGKVTSIPDLAMYGEEDPISKLSQAYYKEGDKVNGKKYWRKKQYLGQALIIEDPLAADKDSGETHQGKVRIIALGYQIYNIIKEAFTSQDDPMDSDPDSFTDGYDFVIKKTEQGEYSTYTMGTKFFSKSRSLSDDELVAAKAGQVVLSTLLPKNPGKEKVQAMLNAHLNGSEYSEGSTSSAPVTPTKPVPARRPVVEADEDDVPFDGGTPVAPAAKPKPATKPVAPAESDDDADMDEVLRQIRERRSAKN